MFLGSCANGPGFVGMFAVLNFTHFRYFKLELSKNILKSVSKLWPLKAAEKIKGSVNRLRESWMDSETNFNRLKVCHSAGAGLDLPSACQSCLILSLSFSFFSLLFLCLHVLHLSDRRYNITL